MPPPAALYAEEESIPEESAVAQIVEPEPEVTYDWGSTPKVKKGKKSNIVVSESVHWRKLRALSDELSSTVTSEVRKTLTELSSPSRCAFTLSLVSSPNDT